MRSARRLTLTGLVVLAGVFVLPAAALAGTGYGFTGEFGSAGTGNGQFKEPEGVTVSEVGATKGDVYVVDKGNNRVEYFSSTGTFEHQFNGTEIDGAPAGEAAPAKLSGPEGIAIDNSGKSVAEDPSVGDVYVVDSGHDVVDKFSATGEFKGQLTPSEGLAEGLAGVAVDPSGNVWLYANNAQAEEFTDRGAYVQGSSFNTGRGVSPGLAVDSLGHLYGITGGRNAWRTTPPESGGVTINETEKVSGIAVAPSTDAVYIDQGTSVVEYGPFAEPFGGIQEEFGSRPGSNPLVDDGGNGVAVSATGVAYVVDSTGDKVDIFTQGPKPEAPLTKAASGETASGAVLHGELNPHVEAQAGWYFAYKLGASCTGGQTTHFETEADVEKQPEEKEVTGLTEPNAQYTFCFVAENTFGPTFGPPQTFTTLAAPPEAVPASEYASGVSSTGATLEAQVNPNNEKTSYFFEYSTSEAEVLASKGTEVSGSPPATELEGYGGQGIAVPIGALLAPGTTYFYRVLAENTGHEKGEGTVQSFTTVPAPTTEMPNPLGTTTATLQGKLTPLNSTVETEYSFEYNLGAACTGGSSIPSPAGKAGTGTGTAQETDPVTGLQPNAAYTVCLFASNSFGSEPTAPVHFTTHAAPPSVLSESASAISSATSPTEGIGALVNPNNEETTCAFEYGTEPLLKTGTTSVPCDQASLGAGYTTTGEPATAHIENLTPGATYYYRVVAKDAAGPADGEIEQFTASVVPTATTGAAQDPARTAIVLDGTVNPNGVATTYHFAYIDQAGYEAALAGDAEEKADPYMNGASTTSQKACTEAELIANPGTCDEGTAPVAVEIAVKGLLPETSYHYILVASNATSTITGADETFATAAATPPLVTTGAASAVTMSTATIAGTVSTQGLDASYAFEVSTEPANPGPPSGGGSVGAGITEASVSVALQGLQPGMTYYYRVLATSTDGTSYGALQTFTTPGFPSPLVQPGTPVLIGTPAIVFPKEEKASGTITKTLTKAEKLAKALKVCAKKPKNKRAACRKQARKKYPPAKKKK